MYHVPMCVLCGEFEVGTFQSHNEFCSDACADKAYEYILDAIDDGPVFDIDAADDYNQWLDYDSDHET